VGGCSCGGCVDDDGDEDFLLLLLLLLLMLPLLLLLSIYIFKNDGDFVVFDVVKSEDDFVNVNVVVVVVVVVAAAAAAVAVVDDDAIQSYCRYERMLTCQKSLNFLRIRFSLKLDNSNSTLTM
jgi:hypothetical protein